MEDEKIKELFGNFQPQLSSDAIFLSRLKQNMGAVEMVKQQVAAQRRRNKIAVIIAAVIGFISGVLMTLLTPAIGSWLSSIQITVPNMTLSLDGQILTWLITAAMSGLIAYNAYQITLTRLSGKTESVYSHID